MNRKYFISSFIAAGLSIPGFSGFGHSVTRGDTVRETTIPPYLRPGDRIGITCPAGYISKEEIQPAVKLIESWGFIVVVGHTVGKKDGIYGGTDSDRLADFQRMLDDQSMAAILCARGGHGAVRIIDALDFRRFKKHPKWIIGFSDITVFHCHLQAQLKVASIHSKMCNSFPVDWAQADPIRQASILSIRKALTGETMGYALPPSPGDRYGYGEGLLVGGNLSLIETLSGSKSNLDTRGKILFLEDTGEYLYSLDRMFWNLKRSGKLDHLSGLIVGGFKLKADDPGEEFGKTIRDIVLEKVSEFSFPICFDFPVGHQVNNFALKCGSPHHLKVDGNGSWLRSL
jgi:muramoyltetrapeptide carboxypeptidase